MDVFLKSEGTFYQFCAFFLPTAFTWFMTLHWNYYCWFMYFTFIEPSCRTNILHYWWLLPSPECGDVDFCLMLSNFDVVKLWLYLDSHLADWLLTTDWHERWHFRLCMLRWGSGRETSIISSNQRTIRR